MPRRREVPKREILPDPKYGNADVAKFVNVLMNFVTSELPYNGSAGGSRRGISRLRGIVLNLEVRRP